ncbi:MAG: amino acid permease [Sphingobacteriales bacterium]|nr:MAG: amino acid permease [Sphingobacteriales bacterium]
MDAQLQRRIGLLALTFYGVGDILGAGVYGLIGKAAGELGNGVWLGFVIGAIAAALTGISYASLGSRYPKAGGCSYILFRAFKSPMLSYVMGFAVLFSGVTSMATSSRAFAGYLVPIAPFLNTGVAIAVFAILIGGIVLVGIKESMTLNIVCTLIEVSGLLIIIFAGFRFIGGADLTDMHTAASPVRGMHWERALSGAILTFYSFIGFEDMLNVSEEVKKPEVTIPKALLMSVFISSAIYLLLSVVAVSVIPPSVLADSTQPLVEVVKVAFPAFPAKLFSFISLCALFNTALLAFITGSRLIYGMSRQELLPAFLSKITKNGSPYNAIFAMLALFTCLVVAGDISQLAKSTSALLLISYTMMNIALVKLKRSDKAGAGRFEVPVIIPILGAIVCVGMLVNVTLTEVLIVGTLFLLVSLLYLIMRPRKNAIIEMAIEEPEVAVVRNG